MKKFRCTIGVLVTFALWHFLGTPWLVAADSDDLPPLQSGRQIIQRLEQSDINYIIESLDSLVVTDPPIVLSPYRYLETTDSGDFIRKYSISEQAGRLVEQGDSLFEAGLGPEALAVYNRILELHPDFYYVLTLKGDAFFIDGQYDSAAHYFRTAIENNFIDYHAHWFLGDTYHRLGQPDSALKYLTFAHLLNINHQVLKERLIQQRGHNGEGWHDWSFNPQVNVWRDDAGVHVEYANEWLAYALVKALWFYEPGYAEWMTGRDDVDPEMNYRGEMNAIAVMIQTDSSRFAWELEIIKSADSWAFVAYELWAKERPTIVGLLPYDQFMRLYKYVDTYH